MPLPQVIHILIHIFTVAAVMACVVLCWLSFRTSPRIVIEELMQVIDHMQARLDTQEGRWKKLNANYALLLAREKSNGHGSHIDEESDSTTMQPGENLIDYKARMRRLMARGKIKHADGDR